MKKFTAILLAVLYLSTSTGATVHLHYCMGQLAEWNLGNKESNTCGNCGMKKGEDKEKGCCKDEHKFFKSDTDQKIAEANIQFIQILAADLPVDFFEIPSIGCSSVTEENPLSHAPPRSSGVVVYIRNCVFLI